MYSPGYYTGCLEQILINGPVVGIDKSALAFGSVMAWLREADTRKGRETPRYFEMLSETF